jgi:hypothetical protein
MTRWIAVLALLVTAARADAACDVNYTGPTNGFWNSAGNWDVAVPLATQNVCIPGGKGTSGAASRRAPGTS